MMQQNVDFMGVFVSRNHLAQVKAARIASIGAAFLRPIGAASRSWRCSARG
jgi:hypothetical protein